MTDVLLPDELTHKPFNMCGVTVESAMFPKSGKNREIAGDNVFVNANGSGVLVDGMGGQGGDFMAAKVGGGAINEQLKSLPLRCTITLALQGMKQGFVDAGEAMRAKRLEGDLFENMGAVAEAVKICHSLDGEKRFALVGHTGDSSTFVFRLNEKKLEKITHDHSLVQRLVDRGEITQEEAFLHPQRNIVANDLGNVRRDTIDTQVDFQVVELHPGDFVISFSDGITDNIRLEELQKRIEESPTALERLRTGSWLSGFASHLCEVAYGIGKEKRLPQAKDDDISVMIFAPARWNGVLDTP